MTQASIKECNAIASKALYGNCNCGRSEHVGDCKNVRMFLTTVAARALTFDGVKNGTLFRKHFPDNFGADDFARAGLYYKGNLDEVS